MVKQITQRKKDELARRKAMPIAVIQRPLKHIRAHTNTKDKDGIIIESPESRMARYAANRGDGAAVQHSARRIVLL